MVWRFRGGDKRAQHRPDDVKNVQFDAAEDFGEQAVDDEPKFILYWLAFVFLALGTIGGLARVF